MINGSKLLIVNDADKRLDALCRGAQLGAIGIYATERCDALGSILGAVHIYKPDIVLVAVDTAEAGFALAELLDKDGYGGAVVFCGGGDELKRACAAMSRGGYFYLEKNASAAGATEKLRSGVSYTSERKKLRRAADSIYLGATRITREYFDRLLKGDDSEFLRLQLSVLGVDLPSSGCVVYCKTFDLHSAELTEKCFAEYKNACRGYIAGEKLADGFIIVTAFRDVEKLKNVGKGFIARNCVEHDGLVVGIGTFSTETCPLVAAVAVAKALATENIFLPSCGVYTESDRLLVHAKKCKRLVGDALKLIREHYAEKISADWAAKQLFVSSSHLMHEFKKELGTTFNECLTKYRILQAKELLSSDSLRINEVARAVGFSDARYFGTVFKEITGVSPGEYARRAEKEQ